jgi:hypothetical protein
VVWFAWQTVKESRKATNAEREAVAELKTLVQAAKEATDAERETLAVLGTLVQAAKDTAASSETTMRAARETAEISQAALDADRRYRQLDQLRAIHRLVQDVRMAAAGAVRAEAMATIPPRPTWRCAQQEELRHALVGAVPELPMCRALAVTSDAIKVRAAGGAAEVEVGDVFRSLGAEGV